MRSRVNRVGFWCLLLGLLLGCDNDSPSRRHDFRGNVDPPSGDLDSWPFSTHLPLVILNTAGQQIPDEPKIPARMILIRDPSGGSNTLDSVHVEFDGPIKIEVRGKTSQQFPKKQYSLKLQAPASLLEFPAGTDWILHGPYSDKSLMRNFLAYELSNRLGRYASRAKYVELVLNDTDQTDIVPRHYAGVYLLMERIERAPNRVRVEYENGAAQDDLAFILKIDKSDHDERRFRTPRGTRVIHVYPEQPDEVRAVKAEAFLATFEEALAGPQFEDPERGYGGYIDMGSFVDYAILNELFKNIDAYRLSTYFHKDRGGKMRMGPVWDFNLSMGNADYYGGDRPRGWLLDHVPDGEGYPIPFWWRRLMESRAFRQEFSLRWRQLRGSVLADAALSGLIEETAALLDGPQQRNFQRWPILGRYVWPNPSPQAKSYREEIDRLQRWMTRRAAWMDKELAALR